MFKILIERIKTYKTYTADIEASFDNGPVKFGRDAVSDWYIHYWRKLEHKLFPWLQPAYASALSLRNSYKGYGIVICVSDHHVRMAYTLLRILREVLHCQLPVEIVYLGYYDLWITYREMFETIPNVVTKDLQMYFDNQILKLKGWAVKPFAMLVSSFEHAMLVDADVVFMQDPAKLFASAMYKESGALFFHDRTMFVPSRETKEWLDRYVPRNEQTDELRIMKGLTAHEMESGVVLIDKKRHFLPLLMVCALNGDAERGVLYKLFHGDKESFWIGFSIMNAGYRFMNSLPGIMGVSSEQTDGSREICGTQLMHLDEFGEPMWFNNGLTENKFDASSKLAVLKEWANEPGQWALKDSNIACFYTRNVTTLKEDAKRVIDRSGLIWQQNLFVQP